MDGVPSAEELAAAVEQQHPGDPRAALAAARELADELAATGDHVLGHCVAVAREAGMTWTDIGGVLGVSKQAVQKRFALRFAQRPAVIGEGLFGRFDATLSEALIAATLAARAEAAQLVTAEHLLAGLSSTRHGRAAAIIQSLAPELAATLAGPRSRAVRMLRWRDTLPFSEDARAAFSRLEWIAEDRGLETLGTEHLLLALADEALSDVGARLHGHGVTRQRIDQILA